MHGWSLLALLAPLMLLVIPLLSPGAHCAPAGESDDEDFANVQWMLDAVHHSGDVETHEYQIKVPCKFGMDRAALVAALEREVAELSNEHIVLAGPIDAIVNLTKSHLPGGRLPRGLSLRHRYYDVHSGPSYAQSFGLLDLSTAEWEPGDEDYFVPSYAVRSRSVTKLEEDVHKCYSTMSRSTKVYGVREAPVSLGGAYYYFPRLAQALGFMIESIALVPARQYGWSTIYWGQLHTFPYKVEISFLYASYEEALRGSASCLRSEWSIRLFTHVKEEDSDEELANGAPASDGGARSGRARGVGRGHRRGIAKLIDRETELILNDVHEGLLRSQYSEDAECEWPLWVWLIGVIVAVFLGVIAFGAVLLFRIQRINASLGVPRLTRPEWFRVDQEAAD